MANTEMERKLNMTRVLEYNIQDSLQQDLHRKLSVTAYY